MRCGRWWSQEMSLVPASFSSELPSAPGRLSQPHPRGWFPGVSVSLPRRVAFKELVFLGEESGREGGGLSKQGD